MDNINNMDYMDKGHKISRMTSDDLDELIKLHSEYLNYGEGIRPHFDKILKDSDSIALKYTVNGETAGIFIYTKGVSLSGNHDELSSELLRLSEGMNVYTGDAVLVRKEYRFMGIADKLCSAMLTELRQRGVQLAVHEFWVYPDGHIPAKKMFRVFNENIFLGRFEYFYRDFHHFGYICPVCGKNCVCAAEIYLAKIPEGD